MDVFNGVRTLELVSFGALEDWQLESVAMLSYEL